MMTYKAPAHLNLCRRFESVVTPSSGRAEHRSFSWGSLTSGYMIRSESDWIDRSQAVNGSRHRMRCSCQGGFDGADESPLRAHPSIERQIQ